MLAQLELRQNAPRPRWVLLLNPDLPKVRLTIDDGKQLLKLFRKGHVVELDSAGLPDGWTNFYRSDDVSATAYFYLGTPENNLPPLQPASYRTAKLRIE